MPTKPRLAPLGRTPHQKDDLQDITGPRLHIYGIKEMPAGFDAEVAELFRDLRLASTLSESELAERLSTDVAVVQALEQGTLYALPAWPETSRVISGYGQLLTLDVRPLLRRVYAQVEAGVIPETAPEEPLSLGAEPLAAPDAPSMPNGADQTASGRPQALRQTNGVAPGHSGQMHPGQMHPGQMHSGQARPNQMRPGQVPPGQGRPSPGQSRPAQGNGQLHPGQVRPGQAHPGQARPGQVPSNRNPQAPAQPGRPQPAKGPPRAVRPSMPPGSRSPDRPGPAKQRPEAPNAASGPSPAAADRAMPRNADADMAAEKSGTNWKRMLLAGIVLVAVVVGSWLAFSEIRVLFAPEGSPHGQAAKPMQTVPDDQNPSSLKADKLPTVHPQ